MFLKFLIAQLINSTAEVTGVIDTGLLLVLQRGFSARRFDQVQQFFERLLIISTWTLRPLLAETSKISRPVSDLNSRI